VAVVCDGMGGLAMGGESARIAAVAFMESWGTQGDGQTIPAALEQAAVYANSAVAALAASHEVPGQTGTTLVGIHASAEGLHWISVGDSGLFLLHDGHIKQLNTMHVYGRVLDARWKRGQITEKEAQSDPQRDAITSYIGGTEIREIDASTDPVALFPGDRVVLASDGLFNTLSIQDIARYTRRKSPSLAKLLIRAALAAGDERQDNVTVCVIEVKE